MNGRPAPMREIDDDSESTTIAVGFNYLLMSCIANASQLRSTFNTFHSSQTLKPSHRQVGGPGEKSASFTGPDSGIGAENRQRRKFEIQRRGSWRGR